MNSLSRLGLGTVQFGLPYGISNSAGKVQPIAVQQILKQSHEEGIVTLDTASAYGESEQVLGDALASQNLQGAFQIVTKLPPKPMTPVHDELIASLGRLRLHGVDGYLFHHFQTWADRPSLWQEMLAVKEAGLTRRVGFSLYAPQELETLWRAGVSPDLIQVPYSVLDQRFEPFFTECRERGTAIHVRSVFLQGLVFLDPTKLAPFFDSIRPNLEMLREMASDVKLDLSLLCLAYPFLDSRIERVLIGVESVANLSQNTRIVDVLDLVQKAKPDWRSVSVHNLEILLPMNWPKV